MAIVNLAEAVINYRLRINVSQFLMAMRLISSVDFWNLQIDPHCPQYLVLGYFLAHIKYQSV